MASCIEDGFTTSPSDQPVFSTDTVDLGVVFTDEPTPTARFTVHNPHSKSLSISDIHISGTNADCFRVNVDGISGSTFSGVEIRGKDSIFVLVEATLPPNASTLPVAVEASLDFTTNGAVRSVVLTASGQNVKRLRGHITDADMHLTAEVPYQIYDSLVVSAGTTLAIDPGAVLCFHDKAMLIVRGTLVAEGTVDEPITMTGDRTGNVVGDISFDIMSRQWQGVFFTATSQACSLAYVDLKNTVQGLTIAGNEENTPDLSLLNCRLHNSAGNVVESYHARLRASGTEFAEGGEGLVWLHGGDARFEQCTFANNYLFAVIGGPAIGFSHVSADEKTGFDDASGLPYLKAEIVNSIIYGLGADISHGDLEGTDVYLRRCLLKSAGENDDNFIDCLWDVDPLYYTVRNDYFFDYRLQPESPAIAAGDAALNTPAAATDRYGLDRGAVPDLGAYVYTPPVEE